MAPLPKEPKTVPKTTVPTVALHMDESVSKKKSSPDVGPPPIDGGGVGAPGLPACLS